MGFWKQRKGHCKKKVLGNVFQFFTGTRVFGNEVWAPLPYKNMDLPALLSRQGVCLLFQAHDYFSHILYATQKDKVVEFSLHFSISWKYSTSYPLKLLYRAISWILGTIFLVHIPLRNFGYKTWGRTDIHNKITARREEWNLLFSWSVEPTLHSAQQHK